MMGLINADLSLLAHFHFDGKQTGQRLEDDLKSKSQINFFFFN